MFMLVLSTFQFCVYVFFFVYLNFAYILLFGLCIVLIHCGLFADAAEKVLNELEA